MTPAKRRPATPVSQGPARMAPDVPIVAPDAPRAEANDGAQLLGPEGEPITDAVPLAQTPQVAADDRATTPAPTRPRTFYPLPVWPD